MSAPGQIWMTALDDIYETDLEVGKGLRHEYGNVYRWVKASAAIAASSSNKALLFNAANEPDAIGTTPAVFLGSGDTNTFAGISLVDVAVPISTYMWILIGGVVTMAIGLDGTPGGADALTHQGATAGTFTKRAAVDEPVDAVTINGTTDIVYVKAIGA